MLNHPSIYIYIYTIKKTIILYLLFFSILMIETLKSLHFQFIYLLQFLENCINIKNVWKHFMYFVMQTS